MHSFLTPIVCHPSCYYAQKLTTWQQAQIEKLHSRLRRCNNQKTYTWNENSGSHEDSTVTLHLIKKRDVQTPALIKDGSSMFCFHMQITWTTENSTTHVHSFTATTLKSHTALCNLSYLEPLVHSQHFTSLWSMSCKTDHQLWSSQKRSTDWKIERRFPFEFCFHVPR